MKLRESSHFWGYLRKTRRLRGQKSFQGKADDALSLGWVLAAWFLKLFPVYKKVLCSKPLHKRSKFASTGEASCMILVVTFTSPSLSSPPELGIYYVSACPFTFIALARALTFPGYFNLCLVFHAVASSWWMAQSAQCSSLLQTKLHILEPGSLCRFPRPAFWYRCVKARWGEGPLFQAMPRQTTRRQKIEGDLEPEWSIGTGT